MGYINVVQTTLSSFAILSKYLYKIFSLLNDSFIALIGVPSCSFSQFEKK